MKLQQCIFLLAMITHRFTYSGLSPWMLAGIVLAIFSLVIGFKTHSMGFGLLLPSFLLAFSRGGVEFDDLNKRYRVYHNFLLFTSGSWVKYSVSDELHLQLGSIYHRGNPSTRLRSRGYHVHYFEIWLVRDSGEPSLLFTFNDHSSALKFMENKLAVLDLKMFDDYVASVEESRKRPRR